jgi:MinD superfamily P-loop ATPase
MRLGAAFNSHFSFPGQWFCKAVAGGGKKVRPMKEILVISGKGGTGKTCIAGSFAALAGNAVLADCDVEAANLHLLLGPSVIKQNEFFGLPQGRIEETKCVRCGLCERLCRFGAINGFTVDPLECEGCGVCFHACPSQAVRLEDNLSGHWFTSETRFGPMVFARLRAGAGNSGKLVTEVKNAARDLARMKNRDLIIVDGPPGVGCPVISSLTGVDLALVVTEPTVAGLHDLERILDLAEGMRTKTAVAINKWDLSPGMTDNLEDYCQARGTDILGRIPFDEEVVKSVVKGISPVESGQGQANKAINDLWREVLSRVLH